MEFVKKITKIEGFFSNFSKKSKMFVIILTKALTNDRYLNIMYHNGKYASVLAQGLINLLLFIGILRNKIVYIPKIITVP